METGTQLAATTAPKMTKRRTTSFGYMHAHGLITITGRAELTAARRQPPKPQRRDWVDFGKARQAIAHGKLIADVLDTIANMLPASLLRRGAWCNRRQWVGMSIRSR